MVYTGVGARLTPPELQAVMMNTARTLAAWGWTLRSGHAAGADQAWERGAREAVEIYLPFPTFQGGRPPLARECHARPTATAYGIAAEHHPAWHRCDDTARALHARNVHEVLGINCDAPSAFLACYTPRGSGSGGTGQAIRLARAYGVPVFDFGRPTAYGEMMAHVVALSKRT